MRLFNGLSLMYDSLIVFFFILSLRSHFIWLRCSCCWNLLSAGVLLEKKRRRIFFFSSSSTLANIQMPTPNKKIINSLEFFDQTHFHTKNVHIKLSTGFNWKVFASIFAVNQFNFITHNTWNNQNFPYRRRFAADVFVMADNNLLFLCELLFFFSIRWGTTHLRPCLFHAAFGICLIYLCFTSSVHLYFKEYLVAVFGFAMKHTILLSHFNSFLNVFIVLWCLCGEYQYCIARYQTCQSNS